MEALTESGALGLLEDKPKCDKSGKRNFSEVQFL